MDARALKLQAKFFISRVKLGLRGLAFRFTPKLKAEEAAPPAQLIAFLGMGVEQKALDHVGGGEDAQQAAPSRGAKSDEKNPFDEAIRAAKAKKAKTAAATPVWGATSSGQNALRSGLGGKPAAASAASAQPAAQDEPDAPAEAPAADDGAAKAPVWSSTPKRPWG
jgi:hypothetical protein